MSFIDQLRWSLRHSRRQLFESVLVVIAITLGVGVIVTILSLFISLNKTTEIAEDSEYMRTIEIYNPRNRWSSMDPPLMLIGDEEQQEWSTSLAELYEFNNRLPSNIHAFIENFWPVETPLLDSDEDKRADMYGVAGKFYLVNTIPTYFKFKDVELLTGSWFLEDDVTNKAQVIVLADTLAELLFGRVDVLGEIIPIRSYWGEDTLYYEVIGVFKVEEEDSPYSDHQNRRTGYAPLSASPLQSDDYGFNGDQDSRYNFISVGIERGADLYQAKEIIEGEAALLWDEGFVIESYLGDIDEFKKQMFTFSLVIGSFASVGLVIAVINILNLMLARVLKRTKSVGLSMALGGTKRQVFRQFLLEALSLGILGSFLGVLLSFGINKILTRTLGSGFSLEGAAWEQILFGLGIGIIISLFFGVYPAYLGAKTNPVDALRTD
ncbi:MAG TPA: ABC transporter permease [Natronincola sp.]|nr:ABC transporter permease [Natronincola sp.]